LELLRVPPPEQRFQQRELVYPHTILLRLYGLGKHLFLKCLCIPFHLYINQWLRRQLPLLVRLRLVRARLQMELAYLHTIP
jgi:hypothetical protein